MKERIIESKQERQLKFWDSIGKKNFVTFFEDRAQNTTKLVVGKLQFTYILLSNSPET